MNWLSTLSQRIATHLRERPVLRRTLIGFGAFVTLAIIAAVIWIVRLDRDVSQRFAEKRFAPPIEFYSAPESIRPGAKLPASYFEELFRRKSYVRRDYDQSMSGGDYSIWSGDQCRSYLGDIIPTATPDPSLDQALAPSATAAVGAEAAAPAMTAQSIDRCVAFVNRGKAATATAPAVEEQGQILALAPDGIVVGIYGRDDKRTREEAIIEAELFAQYYGDKPVLRNVVTFASGEVPPMCLSALLAIEDSKFYEHQGFSLTGLVRGLLAPLRTGRRAQGGSTITQQLVKNYFLSDERTIKRKLTEIAMSFLVEQHATKDDILETYINLIYMGQNGPFEVRGFSAASEHYFGKPLRNLELPECAYIAGVLNGPAFYDPVKHPDRALKRRNLVIERMIETGVIDQAQGDAAKAIPIPARPPRSLTEPAPYFVQAVRRQLAERDIDGAEGLRIYTTLNIRAQEAAQQAVRSGLERIETTYSNIKKIKATGKNLEAVLISADPASGFVQALVGGRGFTATQFNRAVDSHRQVGSVMKPFVYLTALESGEVDGQPYTPLTILHDKATTHKFEKQRWTPKNYEGTYNGDVPLYFALKESLNAATVNLGMAVGLDKIIDTSRRLGLTSKISPLPSLTLGAFELSPLEVLQAYSTITQFGKKVPLTLMARVEDLNGGEIYAYKEDAEQAAAADSVAELIGVMKQTLISGTARAVRAYGFTHPAAGKTGTTNDKKDAWFAGFTPTHTAIVWVGYDDNTSHNLTGGSGAVPIWAQYMKAYGSSLPPDDFAWPEGTTRMTFTPEQLLGYGVPDKDFKPGAPGAAGVELVFREGLSPALPPGTAPSATPNLGGNAFDN